MTNWILCSCLILATESEPGLPAAEVAAQVDALLARQLAAEGVTPTPCSDDAEFLRRVSLDLIGRIPTEAEARTFLDDPSPDKRLALIEQLLHDPEHGYHFANTWRALLIPEADTDRQVRYFQAGFEAWLRERRTSRDGFDDIVRDLLAVPIASPDQPPQFVLTDLRAPNAIAYIASKDADAAKIAANSVRLFLGIRLECAQCHDHPFDHWTREQFWNQAAFFAGLQRRGRGAFSPLTEAAGRRTIMPMESTESVPAAFLVGDADVPSESPPRTAFAEWLTSADNPCFARAVANRLWGQMLGTGIVDPVDDIHAANPPSHPEILSLLEQSFVDSGFDLDFLFRTICLTEAYQRTSATAGGSAADARTFAQMPVKALSGEQFFDSLLIALGNETPADRARPGREDDPVRRRYLDQFASQGVFRDPETSVLQTLTLMNGPLLSDGTAPESGPRLQQLLGDASLNTAVRIESLYLASLSRRPDPDEQVRLVEYVDSGEPAESPRRLGDVLWMVVNSAEFRWNH
jgi:hypothetical protein